MGDDSLTVDGVVVPIDAMDLHQLRAALRLQIQGNRALQRRLQTIRSMADVNEPTPAPVNAVRQLTSEVQ